MHASIHPSIYPLIHPCMHPYTSINAYMHTCMHLCMHVYMNMFMHVCMHASCMDVLIVFMCMCVCIQKLDDDARATARLDVDTDKSIDYRAILERNILISKKIANGELDGGIYRGMGAYRKYVLPKEGAISRNKITGLYGPSRSNNSNVRLTMYIDYKPEICKDYKETGYCGYGDCCKFLHDRTDYKEGWQVDKEWEELQKKKLVNPKP